MKKWIKLISVCLIFLLIDIVSKRYVQTHIPRMSLLHPFYPYGGIAVFKDFLGIGFSINYVQNPGAAWGTFSSYSTYLFAFRVIITLGLLIYLIIKNPSMKKAFGICLILTGAIGNILDHIFYGFVVDMFYFTFGSSHSFPVFNVADSLISIGIVWLLFFTFSSKNEVKGNE